MIIKIKIQSANDIITNSSSETITIVKNVVKNEILDLLVKYVEEHDPHGGSGMGGVLEVDDFNDKFIESFQDIPYYKWNQWTKEMYSMQYTESLEELENMLWIHIDQGFVNTRKFIKEQLNGIGDYTQRDENGNEIENEYDRVRKIAYPWWWQDDSWYERGYDREWPAEYEKYRKRLNSKELS